MKTYLINLIGRTDRYHTSKKELSKIQLDFERIDAISTNSILLKSPQFVSLGVEACWESHKLCYESLLNSDEEYALICEDDIEILNANLVLKTIRWAIENKVDIVQIGFLVHGLKNRFLYIHGTLEMIFFKVLYLATTSLPWAHSKITLRLRVASYGKTPVTYIPDSFFPGTHCYLISRNAARKILLLNNPQFLSADEFFISLSGMRAFSIFRNRKSAVGQNKSEPSIQDRFARVITK